MTDTDLLIQNLRRENEALRAELEWKQKEIELARRSSGAGHRRWSEMTKQEAAAMLVQLYADYSTLCDKYGWPPSDGMSEAVAIAVQSLQEVE